MQDYNITPDSLNLLQRIRYSIFPGTLRKLKDRESYRNFFNSLILHFRPRSVQQRTLRFSLTWGLGGMAVVLVFMMFTTGLVLKFVAVALIAAVMAISVIFNAPLGAKANPGLSPNPTKAPWYFAGIQELLLHFHPLFALFIIPVLMLVGLVSIPYINYQTETAGVWFASHRGRRMAILAALTAVIITPVGIIVDEFVIDFASWRPGLSPVVGNGILPTVFVLAGIIVFYWLVKKKYAATNNESLQSVFVLLSVAFIIVTITGIWFRGVGMALMWP